MLLLHACQTETTCFLRFDVSFAPNDLTDFRGVLAWFDPCIKPRERHAYRGEHPSQQSGLVWPANMATAQFCRQMSLKFQTVFRSIQTVFQVNNKLKS